MLLSYEEQKYRSLEKYSQKKMEQCFPILLLLSTLAVINGRPFQYCPPKDVIKPCQCKIAPNHGLDITCSKLQVSDFVIFAYFKDCIIHHFTLRNSVLNYLPGGIFVGKQLQKISLENVHFLSFISQETAEHIFNGTEDTLKQITIKRSHEDHNLTELGIKLLQLKNLFIDHGRFSEIGYLSDFAPNTETLIIKEHTINRINTNAFSKMKELKKLILRSNNITNMARSMLPQPAPNLETLDLSNNKIKRFECDMFQELPSLKTLMLSNNKITTLNYNLMEPVWKRLEIFSVKGNPIVCSKLLCWISKNYTKSKGNEPWGSCLGPPKLQNRSLEDLKIHDFKFNYGFEN